MHSQEAIHKVISFKEALKSYKSGENSSPKGLRLGVKDISALSFDLDTYNKETPGELFPMSVKLIDKLPGAVLKFIESNGSFSFKLTQYPGKQNQCQLLADDFSIYYGQARTIEGSMVKEGKGYLLVDKTLYCGYFNRDALEGPGMYVSFAGCLSYYRGFWVDGCLQGKGELKTENEYSYIGEWQDNLQDGYGQERWPDNSTYKGDFKQGYKWGHGDLRWHTRGQRYVGQFREGDIEGYGSFECKNGDRYEGEWLNNVMHGRGVFVWNDGLEYDGEYVNGKKEGYGSIGKNGECLWEGFWKNGIRHGKGYHYSANGERTVGYWEDDKLELMEKGL